MVCLGLERRGKGEEAKWSMKYLLWWTRRYVSATSTFNGHSKYTNFQDLM